jgi:ABC-type nitrate/sulfonate/bicarbonate transport system permease component
MHKSNLRVSISAGNVVVGNVRVMLNANWVGVVFAEWLCAKRKGYEYFLVTKGTNQKQVHHLKKENNGNLF